MSKTVVSDEVRRLLAEKSNNQAKKLEAIDNTPQSTPHSSQFVPRELQGYEAETKVWHKLTTELESMKLLHTADLNALTRYCFAWIEWWEATKFIKENGTTYPIYQTKSVKVFNKKTGGYETETKNVLKAWRAFPQVKMASVLRNELLRLEQEFGLTPLTRAKIGTAISNSKSPHGEEENTDPFDYN